MTIPPNITLMSLQMQQWFNVEGERHLLEAESVEDSGDRMEQILNSFTGFLIEANVSLRFSCCCHSVCLFLRLSTCLDLSLFILCPGPKAPRHDFSVRGRATPAERTLLPRDGGVWDSCLHLQVRPGGLSVQSRGVWQGAADYGQRV